MPAQNATFLLASPQPALLAAIEPVLLRAASGHAASGHAASGHAASGHAASGHAASGHAASGHAASGHAASSVEIVLSAQAALAAMTGPQPPALALLDADLPGMPIDDLLAAARAQEKGHSFPIVLISDTVEPVWLDRLAEGILDDLILRATEDSYWQLRIELVLRAFHRNREVELLREAATISAHTDRLTGVSNREALLAALFRETDRVQRLNGSMCLVLFDIDDFGHWNSRLGTELCDELLRQVAARTSRLLRSYDLLGRPGMDEFLVALPGCSAAKAVLLVERLRADVFSVPFRLSGESIRLSACFGMASSNGRSPVVVLREAEEAVLNAKAAGPESVQIFGDSLRPAHAPVTYLSPSSGDELIAW